MNSPKSEQWIVVETSEAIAEMKPSTRYLAVLSDEGIATIVRTLTEAEVPNALIKLRERERRIYFPPEERQRPKL